MSLRKANRPSGKAAVIITVVMMTAFSVATGAVAQTGDGDWNSLLSDSQPVRVLYRDGQERVARRVVQICADELPLLAQQLGLEEVGMIEVEIATDIESYRRNSRSNLPNWGVAFAFMERQIIVVDVQRAMRAMNSLERVLPHELSHLLVAQRLRGIGLPIWFAEGLAQWQAREWTMVDGWQLMNLVWGRDTPVLWELKGRYPSGENNARAAYRISYAAFTHRFGERFDLLPEFLEEVVEQGSFTAGFRRFWDEDVESYSIRFHRELEQKYHTRLLIFQTGPLFSVVAVLFLFVLLRVYLRSKRKYKELDRDEI